MHSLHLSVLRVDFKGVTEYELGIFARIFSIFPKSIC
jgi:hypothetical protein